ncbi:MAG TPA: ABC transporter ATP-binding protein [Aeromonadales bacterium]|nr:ABC transporter ATP-binding protein [Aeromonadales bacterium]
MIQIQHVSKSFDSLKAVDDFSLTISKGEIFGLLGPNGAGKSTTISMSCGLLSADSGKITINALSPQSLEARRLMGLVPQSIALYEELTAEDNLKFFAKLYGIRGAAEKERIRWVLDFVGLSDRQHDLIKEYSGGMKRRLNLAASLLQDPEVIFMDEPTAGVDPQSRNSLFDNVLKLKKLGKTIIYTTHYMEEAEKLCDRVGIIDRGKLLALGSVEALVDQYGGKTLLELSTDKGTMEMKTNHPAADLLSQLQQVHELKDIKLIKPSLETVFLNLTGRQLRD